MQRNLFTGEPEPSPFNVPDDFPADESVIDDGISVVKTDDMAQLIVSGFGLYLGKKSERLVVRKDKNVVYQFPFFRIQEVVVASRGISISADLLEELCVRGIRVNLWGGAGKPYAVISSPYLNATIQTRRDQLTALTDTRGFEFARAIVEGKVRNQEKLVRYFGKYLKTADIERFRRVVTDLKQFAYCPRIPFYQHVMGFHGKSTYKMTQGRVAQDAIEALEKRRRFREYGLTEGKRHFGGWIHSPTLNLAGKLDLLIETADACYPCRPALSVCAQR